jgi:hypothetical protein
MRRCRGQLRTTRMLRAAVAHAAEHGQALVHVHSHSFVSHTRDLLVERVLQEDERRRVFTRTYSSRVEVRWYTNRALREPNGDVGPTDATIVIQPHKTWHRELSIAENVFVDHYVLEENAALAREFRLRLAFGFGGEGDSLAQALACWMDGRYEEAATFAADALAALMPQRDIAEVTRTLLDETQKIREGY